MDYHHKGDDAHGGQLRVHPIRLIPQALVADLRFVGLRFVSFQIMRFTSLGAVVVKNGFLYQRAMPRKAGLDKYIIDGVHTWMERTRRGRKEEFVGVRDRRRCPMVTNTCA